MLHMKLLWETLPVNEWIRKVTLDNKCTKFNHTSVNCNQKVEGEEGAK